jgi:hypothetical protein
MPIAYRHKYSHRQIIIDGYIWHFHEGTTGQDTVVRKYLKDHRTRDCIADVAPPFIHSLLQQVIIQEYSDDP